MSEQRQTYLSALYSASTMDRWAERWAFYWFAYLLAILIFAWTPPDSLNPELGPWGALDAKRWVLITAWASGAWQAYKAIRNGWEARMALHHMHEEQLKKIAPPQQITINDNDGPPKKGVEWGVNHGDNEDREFPEHHEGLHREETFGSSVLGKLIVFNKKKP